MDNNTENDITYPCTRSMENENNEIWYAPAGTQRGKVSIEIPIEKTPTTKELRDMSNNDENHPTDTSSIDDVIDIINRIIERTKHMKATEAFDKSKEAL